MQKKKPFNLILLGDPAAGKETQSKWIAKQYRMFDFDMGHELRRPETKRRFDYDRATARGKLTPTWIVREIFRHNIAGTPRSKGILFDGAPKMVGEARLVVAWLKREKREKPLVIYLHIPVAEILKRTEKRGRKDDAREALMNRIAYYRTDVAKTIAFFKTIYCFKKISGAGTPAAVAKKIEKEINKFINKQGL